MPTRLHCIFVTHTHERIARTLMGMKAQTRTPDSITVAADSDDQRIAAEVARAAAAIEMPITLVLRTRCRDSRRSQNRNNAVRAVLDSSPSPNDTLIFYDGDCIPNPGCNAAHEETLQTRDVSLGWAVRLTPSQTEVLSDELVLSGHISRVMTDKQRTDAVQAERRSRKRIFLKRFGLTKPHKPGILSGNFALSVDRYRSVNGFDESFTGWGAEDDDIARRLYMIGSRPGSSMLTATVYHQHHESEAPPNWSESPNAQRLSQSVSAVAEQGLENPAPQPDPIIHRFN